MQMLCSFYVNLMPFAAAAVKFKNEKKNMIKWNNDNRNIYTHNRSVCVCVSDHIVPHITWL